MKYWIQREQNVIYVVIEKTIEFKQIERNLNRLSMWGCGDRICGAEGWEFGPDTFDLAIEYLNSCGCKEIIT